MTSSIHNSSFQPLTGWADISVPAATLSSHAAIQSSPWLVWYQTHHVEPCILRWKTKMNCSLGSLPPAELPLGYGRSLRLSGRFQNVSLRARRPNSFNNTCTSAAATVEPSDQRCGAAHDDIDIHVRESIRYRLTYNRNSAKIAVRTSTSKVEVNDKVGLYERGARRKIVVGR